MCWEFFDYCFNFTSCYWSVQVFCFFLIQSFLKFCMEQHKFSADQKCRQDSFYVSLNWCHPTYSDLIDTQVKTSLISLSLSLIYLSSIYQLISHLSQLLLVNIPYFYIPLISVPVSATFKLFVS